MPGRHITDQQMRLFMTHRKTNSVTVASAKAGFSTATGYRVQADPRLPSQTKKERSGRRPDPLDGIFESDVVPLLEASPSIRPVAVLEELLRRHPALDPKVRRTLERRIREWKAKHGAEREVIFRQTHEPGKLGLSDFTHMSQAKITISGEPLVHKLYHFRLAYSGYQYAHVVLGGESFVALSEGLQNALWSLGGVPLNHRTDSLSAAFKNLDKAAQDDLTDRFEGLVTHYGMQATRNNRGVAHENGAIESPHRHLKCAIEDALVLRSSRDFSTLDEYRAFIDMIVGRANTRKAKQIDTERAFLKSLPARRTSDYEEATVRVTSGGGFYLRQVFYTVPSRLIGHSLRIRMYDDRLDVYLGASLICTLPRARRGKRRGLNYVVNYHHVIHSLRKKPMALSGLSYRDQLFPRRVFRDMYDVLLECADERTACRVSVALLALAHDRGCETELAQHLEEDVRHKRAPDMAKLRMIFAPSKGALPKVDVTIPPLRIYDQLLQQPQLQELDA